MKITAKIITLAASLLPMLAFGQAKPEIMLLPTMLEKLSNNGEWAIAQKGSVVDGTLDPSGGVVYNIATQESTDISDKSGLSGVADVTNDGSIVVGECQGKPAYWSREKNDWQILPMPKGYNNGRVNSVTPDGHYAVGYVIPPEFSWGAYPVVYDLTSNELVPTPGIPTLDMENEDKLQNCFFHISTDGRYILGALSSSYIYPAALCSYVYDIKDKTYKMIGFTENRTGKWTPKVSGLYFVEATSMSHNGHFVTGSAYMVENSGGEFPREYRAAFKYDYLNDEFTVYNKENEADIIGMQILNDGYMYAVSPAENPYASMLVRNGNYYVGLDKIFSQVYGIDYKSVSGFDVTGKPISVSEDGKTVLMFPTTSDTYLLKLKEPLSEAASKVNLLDTYTVTPASGSIMSGFEKVTLTFERSVETNCRPRDITLKSSDGTTTLNPLGNNGFTANGNNINIVFRRSSLKEGVEYTLTLPKSAICIKGDKSVTTDEIKITYKGRGESNLKMTDVYPADGASVSMLDASGSPMIVSFDADVKLKEGATATLYREGESNPHATLNISAGGNRIVLYPLATQYLFSGTDYKVVIPAGTVTDISGAGPNEEITVSYHGAYVREVSADERFIFSSECNDMNDFILYDGDHFAPTGAPASWGFTADYPWYFVRSTNEVFDHAMASHSMYANGGKADDWMSTPQLFIPDGDCYLSFQAQSYLNGKTDRLKVYVYENSSVYNTFTRDIVDEILTKGDLVFDQVLNPGESEEGLEGDWADFTVSLEKYAGKDVYIAFLNDNQDQSAVFVDNIQVIHDLKYLVTVLSSRRVVALEDQNINGNITISSDIETYNTIRMVLKDQDGITVSEISEDGLNLKKGDVYNFSFDNNLPLVIGEITPYSIEITLNDRKTVVTSEVRSLSFEPTKRIVLEEYSGASCRNCPLGFRAIENIETLYPGTLIPIILRAYGGDILGQGIGGYVNFLGLTAAPSGRINRGEILFPMVSNDTDYLFSGEGLKDSTTGEDIVTWLDGYRKEISQPADADIAIESVYDESTKTINAICSVRNALNLKNVNINVFAVVTENKLETYQDNNLSGIADPDLGEWGLGGKYGSTVYPFIIDHIARGTYGTSYNGTGGKIPSDIKAGETYKVQLSLPLPATVSDAKNCELTVMLIDGGRGTVLNANRVALNGATGAVDNIVSGDDNTAMTLAGNIVLVNTDGQDVSAGAYSADGRLIATASGNGLISLDLGGYKGAVIVKATAENGVASGKFMVK